MTCLNLRTIVATAMLGAGLISLTAASAEEPGTVRISDGVTQTAARSSSGLPPAPLPSDLTGIGVETSFPSGIQPIPEGTNGCQTSTPGNQYYYGDNCNHRSRSCLFGCRQGYNCDRGYCQNPQCQNGNYRNGNYRNGNYRNGNCRNGNNRPSCWSKNALPPDYGFHPPSPHPYIWRQPVVYQRYLPDQPYGTPGMRYSQADQPMVYMPTDTTQLGFNYMHVPQWQPNRANYPMAPNPVMWQRRASPTPKWEDPYRAEHKHFHFGKNERDLMPAAPIYLPLEKKVDSIDKVAPMPVPPVEASIEIDAQI